MLGIGIGPRCVKWKCLHFLKDGRGRNKEADRIRHDGMDISCEVSKTIILCSMGVPENSLFT